MAPKSRTSMKTTKEYDIKARSIYKMNTKNCPLFLVVTNPTLTLDYFNKNARRVLYTRVVWELRKSVKQIVHTSNGGMQPRIVEDNPNA